MIKKLLLIKQYIHWSSKCKFSISQEQRIALSFPGQGCQFVGMLNDFSSDPKYTKVIKEFDNYLYDYTKINISEVMSFKEGEEESTKQKASILNSTEISQPAILLISILNLNKLRLDNVITENQIKYVFGPSLGEIISLVAAESISLNEAGKLLYFRGKFMQESCPKGEGSMLNIIGDIYTSLNLFQKFLLTLSIEDREFINISSIHSKRLIVISGKKGLITKCSFFFKENNIISKQINVSAAFHSKLMEKGRLKFKDYIKDMYFDNLKYNLISTVTGEVIDKNDLDDFNTRIKDILVKQFCEPIRLLTSYQLCYEEDVPILEVVKRKFIETKDLIQ